MITGQPAVLLGRDLELHVHLADRDLMRAARRAAARCGGGGAA